MERYIKYATSGGSIAKYSLTKHCKTGECTVPNAKIIERVNELNSIKIYEDNVVQINYDGKGLCLEMCADVADTIERFLESGGLLDLTLYQKEPIPMVD